MSKRTRPDLLAKPRTTLALRGTTSTPKLQLDHPSALALEWARQWLRAGPGRMGVDPLVSGVARRALAVYIQHLERPDLNPEQEAREVRRACSVSVPDAEERDAAWKRLEARAEGLSFPLWRDVLHGPEAASKLAAFNDRVDALVEQLQHQRAQAAITAKKGKTA